MRILSFQFEIGFVYKNITSQQILTNCAVFLSNINEW